MKRRRESVRGERNVEQLTSTPPTKAHISRARKGAVFEGRLSREGISGRESVVLFTGGGVEAV